MSFIPDQATLFLAPTIFPVTKKSLTTPEILKVGGVPLDAIVDKL